MKPVSVEAQPYLDTLMLLSDPVVLDVATRELELGEPSACLCGWAVRVALGRLSGIDPEAVETGLFSVPAKLEEMYPSVVPAGRYRTGWESIFYGVCNYRALFIEEALVRRVEIAVARA